MFTSCKEISIWPGIINDIKQLVKDCETCNKYQVDQPKLPLMQPDLPTRPWEKLGTNKFDFMGFGVEGKPIRKPRTYIVDINGKVFYRTREHLKPRSNNMPREVNEHFELPIQLHTPMPSSSTNIPPVSTAKPSTPAKAQTPTSLLQPTTPVKFKSPIKPYVGTEKASYQPRSFTTRSGRTTQVPSKFRLNI